MCKFNLVLLFLYCLPKVSFFKMSPFSQMCSHVCSREKTDNTTFGEQMSLYILNGNHWKHSSVIFLRFWPSTADIYKLLKPDGVFLNARQGKKYRRRASAPLSGNSNHFSNPHAAANLWWGWGRAGTVGLCHDLQQKSVLEWIWQMALMPFPLVLQKNWSCGVLKQEGINFSHLMWASMQL